MINQNDAELINILIDKVRKNEMDLKASRNTLEGELQIDSSLSGFISERIFNNDAIERIRIDTENDRFVFADKLGGRISEHNFNNYGREMGSIENIEITSQQKNDNATRFVYDDAVDGEFSEIKAELSGPEKPEMIELEDSLNTEQVLESMARSGVSFTTPLSDGQTSEQMTFVAAELSDGLTVKTKNGDQIHLTNDMSLAIDSKGAIFATKRNPEHNYQRKKAYQSVEKESASSISSSPINPTPQPTNDQDKKKDDVDKSHKNREQAQSSIPPIFNFSGLGRGLGKLIPSKNAEAKALAHSGKVVGAMLVSDLSKANSILDDILKTGGLGTKSQQKQFYDVMSRVGDTFDQIKQSKLSLSDLSASNSANIRNLTDLLNEKLNSKEGKGLLFNGLKAFDNKFMESIKEGVSSLLNKVLEKVSGVSNAPQ